MCINGIFSHVLQVFSNIFFSQLSSSKINYFYLRTA